MEDLAITAILSLASVLDYILHTALVAGVEFRMLGKGKRGDFSRYVLFDSSSILCCIVEAVMLEQELHLGFDSACPGALWNPLRLVPDVDLGHPLL